MGEKEAKIRQDDRKWTQRLSDYLVNDGPKIVFIILWLIANIAVFAERYYRKLMPTLGIENSMFSFSFFLLETIDLTQRDMLRLYLFFFHLLL